MATIKVTSKALRERVIALLKATAYGAGTLNDLVKYWGEVLHAFPDGLPAIYVSHPPEDALDITSGANVDEWRYQLVIKVVVEHADPNEAHDAAWAIFEAIYLQLRTKNPTLTLAGQSMVGGIDFRRAKSGRFFKNGPGMVYVLDVLAFTTHRQSTR